MQDKPVLTSTASAGTPISAWSSASCTYSHGYCALAHQRSVVAPKGNASRAASRRRRVLLKCPRSFVSFEGIRKCGLHGQDSRLAQSHVAQFARVCVGAICLSTSATVPPCSSFPTEAGSSEVGSSWLAMTRMPSISRFDFDVASCGDGLLGCLRASNTHTPRGYPVIESSAYRTVVMSGRRRLRDLSERTNQHAAGSRTTLLCR